MYLRVKSEPFSNPPVEAIYFLQIQDENAIMDESTNVLVLSFSQNTPERLNRSV